MPDYELDPEQDPQQALLEQTLANALRPPLTPAPSPAQEHLTPDDLSLLEPQTSLPALKSLADELPPPLCAPRAGFSLHAARTVDKDDRHGPGRLCKYGLRPPFAADRISILPDGRIRYELRKPWPTREGSLTGDLLLDPVDFLRRLAALVPPPTSI